MKLKRLMQWTHVSLYLRFMESRVQAPGVREPMPLPQTIAKKKKRIWLRFKQKQKSMVKITCINIWAFLPLELTFKVELGLQS